MSPSLIPDPDVSSQYLTSNSNNAVYKFGNVNETAIPFLSSCNNATIVEEARQNFLDVPHVGGMSLNDYYNLLDKAVWELVCNWRNNHNIVLNPSRCIACLIINKSSTFVQFLDTELKEGSDVFIFGVGDSYDVDSRTIVGSGGAAVVFAYGHVPTLLDLAHVKVKIITSAFTATVSTRKTKTNCVSFDGHHAAFHEKSRTDYWSKTVIIID